MKKNDIKNDTKSINQYHSPRAKEGQNPPDFADDNLRDIIIADSVNKRHTKYPVICYRDADDKSEAELLRDYLNHNIKEYNIEPIVVQNEMQEHRIIVVLSHIETLDQLQMFVCDASVESVKAVVTEYLNSYKAGTCAVLGETQQVESQIEQVDGNLAAGTNENQANTNLQVDNVDGNLA